MDTPFYKQVKHSFLIIYIVETKHEFIDIGLQIFYGTMLIDAVDATFQNTPKVFHVVCMDISVDVLFCVANDEMDVFLAFCKERHISAH
jgi:hypothetical protein